MYRINRLNRNVLITPDEVLFHAATVQDVDERQILQNIIVAEERFIVDAICDEIYEDFIEQKNKTVTSENQEEMITKINQSFESIGAIPITENDLPIGSIVNAIEFVTNESYVRLWNRFLWKITAECVDFISTVPSWLQHTSQGQMMNSPKVIGGSGTNSSSGDVKDVSFKLDNTLHDRINPLLQRMEEWICKNKTSFPLYCKPCMDCGCIGKSDELAKKSNFIIGIYED